MVKSFSWGCFGIFIVTFYVCRSMCPNIGASSCLLVLGPFAEAGFAPATASCFASHFFWSALFCRYLQQYRDILAHLGNQERWGFRMKLGSAPGPIQTLDLVNQYCSSTSPMVTGSAKG